MEKERNLTLVEDEVEVVEENNEVEVAEESGSVGLVAALGLAGVGAMIYVGRKWGMPVYERLKDKHRQKKLDKALNLVHEFGYETEFIAKDFEVDSEGYHVS